MWALDQCCVHVSDFEEKKPRDLYGDLESSSPKARQER